MLSFSLGHRYSKFRLYSCINYFLDSLSNYAVIGIILLNMRLYFPHPSGGPDIYRVDATVVASAAADTKIAIGRLQACPSRGRHGHQNNHISP